MVFKFKLETRQLIGRKWTNHRTRIWKPRKNVFGLWSIFSCSGIWRYCLKEKWIDKIKTVRNKKEDWSELKTGHKLVGLVPLTLFETQEWSSPTFKIDMNLWMPRYTLVQGFHVYLRSINESYDFNVFKDFSKFRNFFDFLIGFQRSILTLLLLNHMMVMWLLSRDLNVTSQDLGIRLSIFIEYSYTSNILILFFRGSRIRKMKWTRWETSPAG